MGWGEFKKELPALRFMDGFKGCVGELVVMTHWPGLLFKSISKSTMCKLKKPDNQIWPLNHAVKWRNVRIPIVILWMLLVSTGELSLATAFRCFCSIQIQIQSLVHLCLPSFLEKNSWWWKNAVAQNAMLFVSGGSEQRPKRKKRFSFLCLSLNSKVKRGAVEMRKLWYFGGRGIADSSHNLKWPLPYNCNHSYPSLKRSAVRCVKLSLLMSNWMTIIPTWSKTNHPLIQLSVKLCSWCVLPRKWKREGEGMIKMKRPAMILSYILR